MGSWGSTPFPPVLPVGLCEARGWGMSAGWLVPLGTDQLQVTHLVMQVPVGPSAHWCPSLHIIVSAR